MKYSIVAVILLALAAAMSLPDYEAYKAGEYREFKPCHSNAVVCFFTREYK